ncbi:hypothetical protein WN55_08477 [Dufourea novaeangliae]|uniref:Uncharacterized protein n=1 Tax=Dufourea novaeangliae TaxID=178035 RepID=A0A154P573_DUFNO|nr:hypothetical protein WN55_08477 [Dufourea novaeangliae]
MSDIPAATGVRISTLASWPVELNSRLMNAKPPVCQSPAHVPPWGMIIARPRMKPTATPGPWFLASSHGLTHPWVYPFLATTRTEGVEQQDIRPRNVEKIGTHDGPVSGRTCSRLSRKGSVVEAPGSHRRIDDTDGIERRKYEKGGGRKDSNADNWGNGVIRYCDATSGRIWLVNQRCIVRNEPPHSAEFNAHSKEQRDEERTWDEGKKLYRARYGKEARSHSAPVLSSTAKIQNFDRVFVRESPDEYDNTVPEIREDKKSSNAFQPIDSKKIPGGRA